MNQDNNMQNQDPTTNNATVPSEQAPNPPVGGGTPQTPGTTSGKKKSLMIIIAVVLVVVIGGVIAWMLMRNDSSTPQDNASMPNTNQTASSFGTPEETVATVDTKMKDLIGAQGAFTYSADTSTSDPKIYVSKDDYAVAVDTTPDLYTALKLTASPAANSPETQTAATKKAEVLSTQLSDYLKGTGAFTVTTIKQSTPTGDYSDKVIFSKSGLVCETSLFVTYDPSFSIGCVKQVDADAALAEYAPFITEYLKHGKKAVTYSLTYKDGKNNYKIANLLADNKQYAFLQKSGASNWDYFSEISYQDAENCSLYESDADAALAFAGASCYRNNASSTVGGR